MPPYFLLGVISGEEMKEISRTDLIPNHSQLSLRLGTDQMKISPEQTVGVAAYF